MVRGAGPESRLRGVVTVRTLRLGPRGAGTIVPLLKQENRMVNIEHVDLPLTDAADESEKSRREQELRPAQTATQEAVLRKKQTVQREEQPVELRQRRC